VVTVSVLVTLVVTPPAHGWQGQPRVGDHASASSFRNYATQDHVPAFLTDSCALLALDYRLMSTTLDCCHHLRNQEEEVF
jgi:hypothetical protein